MKKNLLLSLIVLFSCSKDSSEPEIPRYTLTVTANPPEGGLVNPQTGTYNSGQTVNIIASANDFFAFSNWTGNWNGTENSFTITMDSNKNITANFEDLDIDNDLVLDSIDNCLNTAAGESVDQSGCSISQLDDDGDGVANGIDQCPGSLVNLKQYGVEFDSNGCKIDFAYLDENGVTVKAYPDSPIGKVTYINHPLYDNDPNVSESSDVVLWKIVDDEMLSGMYPHSIDDLLMVLHGSFTRPYKMGMVTTNLTELINISSLYYSTWDLSNVKKIEGIRIGSNDLSFWDVSNVTDMYNAFDGSILGSNTDLSSWDVSNVTNMRGMFRSMNRYDSQKDPTSLDLSSWDVSNVTDMACMFCSTGIVFIDFSGWDVSNVTNMGSMFDGVDLFGNSIIDLSGWDVSNVTNCVRFADYNTRGGSATIISPNFTNCSD